MGQCGHHGHQGHSGDCGAHQVIQPHSADICVNDVWISAEDVAREAQYHPAETAQQALESAAQALVIRQLLRQQAVSQGLLPTDTPVGSDQEEAAFQALLQREVEIPDADDAAVARYYDANPDKFTAPPLLEVSHILVAADPRDFAERQRARERAEDLIAECQGDADRFVALATAHSACPSRQEGGALGQVSKGQTTPEFERQLFLLPTGLAGTPLESRYGFHVVWVWQRVDGQLRSLIDCRPQIQEYLRDHAWIKGVNQYLNWLVGEAKIEGFDIAGATSPLMN